MTAPTIVGSNEGRPVPYRCPICAIVPGDYAGKLVFNGEEAPVCENHAKPLRQGRLTVEAITMVPVPGTSPAAAGDTMRQACRAAGGEDALIKDKGWCRGHPAQ